VVVLIPPAKLARAFLSARLSSGDQYRLPFTLISFSEQYISSGILF
jgi:hypothetical protein